MFNAFQKSCNYPKSKHIRFYYKRYSGIFQRNFSKVSCKIELFLYLSLLFDLFNQKCCYFYVSCTGISKNHLVCISISVPTYFSGVIYIGRISLSHNPDFKRSLPKKDPALQASGAKHGRLRHKFLKKNVKPQLALATSCQLCYDIYIVF